MKRIIHRDLRERPSIPWLLELYHQHDIRLIDWIRIDLGRGRYAGAYGRCWYAVPKLKRNYRISIQVPGPFPCRHFIYMPPLYANPDGQWPDPPAGCEIHAHVTATGRDGNKRQWRSVRKPFMLASVDEGIVHIGAHELFHFLRRTRQIPGRNSQAEADQYAHEQLERWIREHKTNRATALPRTTV